MKTPARKPPTQPTFLEHRAGAKAGHALQLTACVVLLAACSDPQAPSPSGGGGTSSTEGTSLSTRETTTSTQASVGSSTGNPSSPTSSSELPTSATVSTTGTPPGSTETTSVPSDSSESTSAPGSQVTSDTSTETQVPSSSEPPAQTTDEESPFLLGADISSLPEFEDAGATFVDTDGQTKSLVEILANHGFNAVRLRTFVNPKAAYGYAEGTGGSCSKPEAYNDAAHTAELGARVKAAGMQLLVDFHYSDTWADPGKQIIPEAWRGAATVDELAEEVRSYTTAVLEQLVQAGAKPDMVQVGNETTPGMLIHVPGANTDCWGNNSVVRTGVNGQASNGNWDNLAKLFDAGAEAVHAVDPTIKVVLHIENTDDVAGVRWWVDSAVSRGVKFDVLGLSAYTAFQGQPSVWKNTLDTIASEYPSLEFIIAEYNPERSQANRIVFGLPNRRGLGTFFWEPAQSGSWGESLFTQSGNVYTARATDFAEYDALRGELGL